MYICIYVYMYICIYAYMYICMYVYMCIRVYVYMGNCIYVYMYICTYVHMYICTYVYTRPNYMPYGIGNVFTACRRAGLCELLRENMAIFAFGNPERPYFHAPAVSADSKVTCFTVPAEIRISGTTCFCGFPVTGVPNMPCFSTILAAGGGPCPGGPPGVAGRHPEAGVSGNA